MMMRETSDRTLERRPASPRRTRAGLAASPPPGRGWRGLVCRAGVGRTLLVMAWLLIATHVHAQAPAAGSLAVVPRFAIAASPIGLAGDVRPRQYLGVVGRQAAWLGSETGESELWVHPLKLATGFRIDFRIPDYVEPVRGADVARTVEVRPELATITYSHATFTVRQHILAPLAQPGLLVLLEVDTFTKLEIVVSFQSALQYAWPGGLGGQYALWDGANRAFVLSESLRRHNAFIGSPWASAASSHPAHAVPDAPSTFSIPVDAARARQEFIPIAVAAGIGPRDEVAARYRELLASARALYDEKRAHVDRLLGGTARVRTPDAGLDLALAWATVNLDEQVVCNPDLGCGLVAGWGPSGRGARPGFGWYFGGDAAINSFAMSGLGMRDDVAQGLRFLGKYQRDDGKVPHEISQAAGRIPWFTDFPYTYYHADTTPFWLVALGRHWRATADRAIVDELWPRVRKAWAWCLTTDTDGDGLMENTSGGLGAIEVGDLGRDIHQDIYLAAVWIEAIKAMAEMADAVGDAKLASEARERLPRALETLNNRYWLDAAGHHAFGLLRSGRVSDALTVWPATAASFGLFDGPRAAQTLRKLAGPRLATDWGVRMLARDHPLYEPTHYNMGAVWPFVTGFVAAGQYEYRRPWAGFPLVKAVARMTFDWARGRHPELLSGAYYRPLDAAVPHQFFATSMLVTPFLHGVLGWRPDAASARARLAPQLPPSWDRVSVERLAVGGTRVAATFAQSPAGLTTQLQAEGPPVDLTFAPNPPPGARRVAAAVDGRSAFLDAQGELRLRLSASPVTVRVTWQGGLSLEPADPAPRPGQRSAPARVVDFAWADGGWTVDVEGSPGASLEFVVVGSPVREARGGEVVGREGPRTRLRATLPASGDEFVSARVTLVP
jgi:hypothetical protein